MSEKNITFEETLKRLIGVYVIIRFINPHDELGGILKAVDDEGKVTFEMDGDMSTHITFIDHVVIPNEDKARESPLAHALKKAQL